MVTRASTDQLANLDPQVRRDPRDHLERLGRKEIWVAEVSRAHMEPLARRERTVCLVLMERTALLASLESRVPQGRLGGLVVPVTREQQVCLAAPEPRVDLEARESLVPEAMLECLVPQDLRVSLVFPVKLVWRVFLVLRVTEARGEL